MLQLPQPTHLVPQRDGTEAQLVWGLTPAPQDTAGVALLLWEAPDARPTSCCICLLISERY